MYCLYIYSNGLGTGYTYLFIGFPPKVFDFSQNNKLSNDNGWKLYKLLKKVPSEIGGLDCHVITTE